MVATTTYYWSPISSTSAFAAVWIKSSHKKYLSWLRLSCLPVTLPNGTDGPCWHARALLNMINPQTGLIAIPNISSYRWRVSQEQWSNMTVPIRHFVGHQKRQPVQSTLKAHCGRFNPPYSSVYIYIYIYSSWSLYYMSNWIFFGQCKNFTLQLVWITQQKNTRSTLHWRWGPNFSPLGATWQFSDLREVANALNTHKKWLTVHPTKSLKYPNCT